MLVNTFREKGGERNKGDFGGAGHVLFFVLGGDYTNVFIIN